MTKVFTFMTYHTKGEKTQYHNAVENNFIVEYDCKWSPRRLHSDTAPGITCTEFFTWQVFGCFLILIQREEGNNDIEKQEIRVQ